MKLSKNKLNQIIQEEYNRMLQEQTDPSQDQLTKLGVWDRQRFAPPWLDQFTPATAPMHAKGKWPQGLAQGAYGKIDPSGQGIEEAYPDPETGEYVGRSRPLINQELRNISRGTAHPDHPGWETMPGTDYMIPGYISSAAAEEDAQELDPRALDPENIAHTRFYAPVDPYTPGPSRPAYGYTPINPRSTREAEKGRRGMPGRGQNRFDESLARQIEQYIYKTLKG